MGLLLTQSNVVHLDRDIQVILQYDGPPTWDQD